MTKYILSILFVSCLSAIASGTALDPSEQVTLGGRTVYRDGNLAEPDSMRIQVFRNGTEVHDAWYKPGDQEVTPTDGWLIFSDQFQNIDGAGGEGQYMVLVRSYDNDSALYTPSVYSFQIGIRSDLAGTLDSLGIILDSLRSQDDWVSRLSENDNIGVDLDDIVGTLDSAEIGEAFLNSSKIAANTIADQQLSISAAAEIAYTVWLYSQRTVTGGIVDSNRASIALDSAGMANAVWNAPQSNHTIAGSFGDNLDAKISTIGSGGGTYVRRFIAYDSTVGQVIPGANMVVRNLDQTALIAAGDCNVFGEKWFNLDLGSYVAAAIVPGYIFASPDTVTVTGPGTDTLYGYQFDPGTADIPGLCRVYGFLYDLAGNPEINASVSARIPSGVSRSGSGIVSPFAIETETDTAGYFHFDLIPNVQLVPDTTRYEVTITLNDGTVLRERVTVPDQPEWLLTW